MKVFNALLFRLTAGMPTRLIKLDGRPYLERYFVGRLLGITFYLHRFISADRERHLHNHPWTWARALVLSGGYDEEIVVDLAPDVVPHGCVLERRAVRWWNRIDGNHFHRIANARPRTWTLFFHGERQHVYSCGSGGEFVEKGWGFLESATLLGGEAATVFRLWPSAHSDWHVTAPSGRDIGRTPL